MSRRVGKVAPWLLSGLRVAVLAALAGCSPGAEGPTTYPVKGKVLAPGGKPWTGGRVGFQSAIDPGTRATGEIQADGSFTLETVYLVEGKPRVRSGAVAGEYTVALEEPGTTFDRGGTPNLPPQILRKKYRVEEKENAFVLDAGKPAKP